MKKICFGLMLLSGILFSCATPEQGSYKTPEMKLESDIMTPEVLWSFGRIGGVALSPDGEDLLYNVTYFNKEENSSYCDLYILNIASKQVTRLTDTKAKEAEPTWTPDGKVAFLSAANGSMQLYEMDKEGKNRRQITDVEGGIGGFIYAPDKSGLLYLKDVKLEQDVHDQYPDLPKANARLIDGDRFYRHWDSWVEVYTHPFVAALTGEMVKEGIDIMEGEHWESPVRPFGGVEELTWTTDGNGIIYTARKRQGVDYGTHTDTDIYLYNLKQGSTRNLTHRMPGLDNHAVLSPSGQWMAWESMERDGYESDKTRLFVMDIKSGMRRDFTVDFDYSATSLTWADDHTIYFIADIQATDEIFRLNIDNGKIDRITNGIWNYLSVIPNGDHLIATRQSMSCPTEIYKVEIATGEAEELSFVNASILNQLEMGRVEKRWIKTTDNKQMLTWVIYPPHFDPNKKYPAILYCEGGPQSTVSQFWSYRWNFQMMAANGYIVVAPNRRGLPGFGMEWLEQISGDYHGQNMKDYLSAIDALMKEPFIDENRVGCVGASYGGYSVYYLAGHHEKRFKAFIAHCGIFNLDMQYSTTEETWFANWDMGGAPWDLKNKVAQNTYAHSPHLYVGNWDTPMLVIHGQKDFRVDAAQGMSAFNAARLSGIPARYLYFPEESHWVLSVQNGILWQRVFFDWLDRYLK